MKRFFLSALIFCIMAAAFGQANTKLSNLVSPTAVNQSLLPSSSNSKDVGSSSLNWRSLYFKGSLYKGSQRLLSTTGRGNTFIGLQSGKSNTGTYNSAVGDSALLSNTTGVYNTASGAFSLYKNTTGYTNTAVGYNALDSNTIGYWNTASGGLALSSNTTGNSNTASGFQALYANTTGYWNTASGSGALFYNTTGSYNTASGIDALSGNTTGNYNTADGFNALTHTTASNFNTAVGFYAGVNYNNGWNNVFVGALSDVSGAGLYNVIAIGEGTICTAPSQVTIGNSSTNSYRAYAGWTNISDGRYKKNIKEDVPGLSFINKLHPITYNLDATGLDAFLNKGRSKEALPTQEAQGIMQKALKEKEALVQTGFVAQEVEKAARELNYDFSGVDKPKNSNDVYGLRYSDFVVPLVKAVQQLDSAGKAKDHRIATLETQVAELRQMVLDLKNGNNTLTLNSASLEQNIPNPVSGITTIRYHLPENVTSAVLHITNAKGQVVKTMSLTSHSAQVNLNTTMLAAGTYNYSLIVDGKQVGTKRLVIAR